MSTLAPESFFSSPTPLHSVRRRLLLISYHFPPSVAAGALRWQKFARFAAAQGWGLDVLTLDPQRLSEADTSQLQDLPDGVRVFGIEEPELTLRRIEDRLWRTVRARGSARDPLRAGATSRGRHSSFHRNELRFQPFFARGWIRAYEAWMSVARYGGWARRAARVGRRIFEPGRHHAVISCGPPHMAHEGGRLLASATGLPHVLDLRDPWSLVERLPEDHASPVWLWLAARHEARCVGRAALVVMNTEPARQAMRQRYPRRADRIIAVTNGYDEETPPSLVKNPRFLLAYAGSVYLDRSPRILFRAVANLIRERELRPTDLGLEFMGHVHEIDGLSIEELAAQEGIGTFVKLRPPGTRAEVEQLLGKASVLVSLPQDSHLCIPSKVFEYMRHDAWLLALAERGSAPELLLRETQADVVEPDDVEGLAAVLDKRYAEYLENRRPRAIAPNERLSRRAQAQHLFDAIEDCVRGSRRERSGSPVD